MMTATSGAMVLASGLLLVCYAYEEEREVLGLRGGGTEDRKN